MTPSYTFTVTNCDWNNADWLLTAKIGDHEEALSGTVFFNPPLSDLSDAPSRIDTMLDTAMVLPSAFEGEPDKTSVTPMTSYKMLLANKFSIDELSA